MKIDVSTDFPKIDSKRGSGPILNSNFDNYLSSWTINSLPFSFAYSYLLASPFVSINVEPTHYFRNIDLFSKFVACLFLINFTMMSFVYTSFYVGEQLYQVFFKTFRKSYFTCFYADI